MNLLQETEQKLQDFHKTPADVLWAGSTSYGWMTWEDFANLAKDADYSDGFGCQEVASDLRIVGDGWWLERHEYDGAEEWRFKTYPQKPEKRIFPNALTVRQSDYYRAGWETLEDLNEDDA